MRVIFLDVDGVLNSEDYLLKLEAQHRLLGHTEPASPKRETTCDCFKLYHQIDRDAVARVNRIATATGAKIVVSSTWRKLFDPPDLRRVLEAHGLAVEIIGQTPDGHKTPEMASVYGHIERMYRGYEIDFWLRQHPEVDRFVILDDGSDMVMHVNRLVQTDCQDGLCDEHVELAIRVMAWDGVSRPSPMDDMEDEEDHVARSIDKAIVSTRSNTNEDARRDFDDFDVDEELARLRRALRNGQWRVAAELTANLDEHLSRGGSLPVAWLGPTCMQEQADLAARLAASMEVATKMTATERRAALNGYVAVAPAPVEQPGSSAGIHCAHNQHLREGRCLESLVLERTTAVQPTHEDDYQYLMPAQAEAAVLLGWRVYQCVWWCPTHVATKNLACKRCMSACPSCSCVGGPFSDAVEGLDIEATEVERS